MAIDVERLKQIELHYGGMFRDARVKNSPLDEVPARGDRGGDRMVYQDYAPLYAMVLPDRAQRVVEMGIFKGTGLALWADLYEGADIIGLDIDIDRYLNHKPELVALSAFRHSVPRVMEFDELDGESWFNIDFQIEDGSVDVWIDDAIHRTDVILNAWERAEKFMAPRSVYIIEDNSEVGPILQARYAGLPNYEVYVGGEDYRLTAICKLP